MSYATITTAAAGLGELVDSTEFINRADHVNAEVGETDAGMARLNATGKLDGPTWQAWQGFRGEWSQWYGHNVQNIPWSPFKFTNTIDAYKDKNLEWRATLSAIAGKPIVPGPSPVVPSKVPSTFLPPNNMPSPEDVLKWGIALAVVWYGWKFANSDTGKAAWQTTKTVAGGARDAGREAWGKAKEHHGRLKAAYDRY